MNKSVISIITPISESTISIRQQVSSINAGDLPNAARASFKTIIDLTLAIDRFLEYAIANSVNPINPEISVEKEIINA